MKAYVSPITATLEPDNWRNQLSLRDMSLDDLTDLLGDLKQMESFGKKVGGFIREIVVARMPEGETEYASPNFSFILSERTRAGGLDKEKIEEEMDEVWIQEHTKPATEFTELRMTRVLQEEGVGVS